MAIYLRRATMDDVSKIMEIIQAAKKFLKDQNNPQWQDGHPTAEMIKDDIAKEYSWVLIDGKQLVGTADLQLAPEKNYAAIEDGRWAKPNEPYAIIHRVATSASDGDERYGQLLFSNLITVGRLQGIKNFRYDTHAKNIPMQKLGKKLGFIHRGTVFIKDDTDPKHLGFELNVD